MTSTPTRTDYICRIGFSHEPADADHQRFEPGDHVTGLPEGVQRELAKARVIEAVPAKRAAKRAPRKEAA